MNRTEADVCVVGAGYAGLTAALRLSQAGKSVVVLEARDRVGGRVYTTDLDDGSWVDLGGTWLGPPQKAIYDLAREMGVETYPTWNKGEQLFFNDGKRHTYSGGIPWINPLSMADLGLAMMTWDNEAKNVPTGDPWDAPKAEEYDRMSMAEWIVSGLNAPDKLTRKMLTYAVEILFSCDPAEVSYLDLLWHIHAQGGLEAQMGTTEQDRFVGGAQEILNRIAARLGDAVHLNAPVRIIAQHPDGVDVIADGIAVHASDVVVAVPPSLCNRIDFEPALPVNTSFLFDRIPIGCAIKYIAVYDEPFWRNEGLTGQILALDMPIGKTMDISPQTGPGMMTGFATGTAARTLQKLLPDERKRVVIDAFVRCFGSRAASPSHFFEQDWSKEKYSRGCYMSHYGPGVLRQWGHYIREPVGRIRWASTETSVFMNGNIEGALLAGERACQEILQGGEAPAEKNLIAT